MLFPITIHRTIVCGCMLVLFAAAGCKKLVEVDSPVTSVNANNVFTNDVTSIAVMTGVYSKMSNNASLSYGITSLNYYPELSADGFSLYSGTAGTLPYFCYTNQLSGANISTADFWSAIYPLIYTVNATISGLQGATGLTPAIALQLMGEAKFIRAFCYSYLINLYGDVPLALGTDYTINTSLTRTPSAQVWQQVISDLKDAENELSSNFLDVTLLASSTQRLRPSKWAAAALLARVYLCTGSYDSAIAQATIVINNSAFFTLGKVNNVFIDTCKEAIWQLQPVQAGYNTQEARLFTIPSTGISNVHPAYLSPFLLSSFEAGDQRRVNWVDSVIVMGQAYYFPYKYKVSALNASVTEYEDVLRLGEQYLIRAEAEADGGGGGIPAAIADLNVIRSRAGLPPYGGGSDKQSVLSAILHERQVELFAEWGHRWFDLKRMHAVDSTMSIVTPAKGGSAWNTDWQLYPITLGELQANPLLTQTPGY